MTTAPTTSYKTLIELKNEIVKYGLKMMEWAIENPDEVVLNYYDIECSDREQMIVENMLKKLGIKVE